MDFEKLSDKLPLDRFISKITARGICSNSLYFMMFINDLDFGTQGIVPNFGDELKNLKMLQIIKRVRADFKGR